MQILAVVANIQMRTLKAEVGNGSLQILIGEGLVGPEDQRNCWKSPLGFSDLSVGGIVRKGKGLIFPYYGGSNKRQRSCPVQTPIGSLGKVIFFSLRAEDH